MQTFTERTALYTSKVAAAMRDVGSADRIRKHAENASDADGVVYADALARLAANRLAAAKTTLAQDRALWLSA